MEMPNAANAENSSAPATVMCRVALPTWLLDHFEGLAAATGVDLDAYLADHLTKTAFWGTDEAPIYLKDSERAGIQRMLGAKVSTPERLLEMISRLVAWKAGPHKIELRPNQLEQLAQIAKTLGRPLAEVAPQVLADAITEKLGTR